MQILGRAINRVNRIVSNAADARGRKRTRPVMYADLVVPDHNGGEDYGWLAGGGRRQPYWPAVKELDADLDPVMISWEYDTSAYTRRFIKDDPAFFQNYSISWTGASWTSLENIHLWADALRDSKKSYGDASTAAGMICTNWGGGRIEAGLAPTAAIAWNLREP